MKMESVKLLVLLSGYVFTHSHTDEQVVVQHDHEPLAQVDPQKSRGQILPTRVASTIRTADGRLVVLGEEPPPPAARQPVPSGSFTTVRDLNKALGHVSGLANRCPPPTSACPIFSSSLARKLLARSHSLHNLTIGLPWECVNLQEELTACGTCTNNCMKIKHAKEVGCEQGRCKIFTCRAGYSLVKRSSKGGHSVEGHPIERCVLLKKGRA
ncbi:hypothetical protein PGT21_029877 [Puccinia graminis f. sp. tritici]|uniref:Protein CPL1-like domain-containing protein n=1 Tax=Puccinia graminis f. sp. tritici TaxID=56615 RepID=A0A5B0MZ52_PUCGR|nr:hypothetical protein PGT21_029877 [Puccinia graminis f. sp. tritici]KAA1131290.1 hypothetical protein PGTUg99_029677 [Puccinia graminis f. sp. tritici]